MKSAENTQTLNPKLSKQSISKRKTIPAQRIIPSKALNPRLKSTINHQVSKENFKKKDQFGNDILNNTQVAR